MAEERPRPKKARPKSERSSRAQLTERLKVESVRCPFCHDDITQDALAARCVLCFTVHHPTCFDEQGGCSVAGCASKVADITKGWRAGFAPCKACNFQVYLDENVVLCKQCDSPHHPMCLEERAGCATCGSGEGILIYAGAYREARAKARRWSLPFLLLPVAMVSFLVASIFIDKEMSPTARTFLVAGVLFGTLLSVWGAVMTGGYFRRRAIRLATPRVSQPMAGKLASPSPEGPPTALPLPMIPPSSMDAGEASTPQHDEMRSL